MSQTSETREERRQRYAEAIHAAGPIETNGTKTIADAVMAIADLELRAEQAKAANLLRYENDRANKAIAREDVGEEHAGELEQENARLRRGLNEMWQRWFLNAQVGISFREFTEGIGGDIRALIDEQAA